jgi:flagellar basal body-associated protein FliL
VEEVVEGVEVVKVVGWYVVIVVVVVVVVVVVAVVVVVVTGSQSQNQSQNQSRKPEPESEPEARATVRLQHLTVSLRDFAQLRFFLPSCWLVYCAAGT